MNSWNRVPMDEARKISRDQIERFTTTDQRFGLCPKIKGRLRKNRKDNQSSVLSVPRSAPLIYFPLVS